MRRLFKSFSRILPKRTLQVNLTVFIMITSTVTAILLCLFVYSRLTGYIKHENTLYVENMTQGIGEQIDMVVRQIDQNSRIMVSYTRIQDILLRAQQPGYSEPDFLQDHTELTYFWVSFSNVGEDLVVCCYDTDGKVLFYKAGATRGTPEALFSNPWLLENRQELNDRQFFMVSSNRLDTKIFGKLMPYMVIRPLKDYTGREIVAYIAIFADANRMQGIIDANIPLLRELHRNGLEPQIHVLDPQGQVMVSTNANEIGLLHREEPGRVYYRSRSGYSRLEVVLSLDQDFYRSGTDAALLQVLLLFLVLVAFTGITASVVVRYRLAPLRELSNCIDRVRDGDFDTRLDAQTQHDADMEFLFRGFNHMVEQTQLLLENVSSQKLVMKSIELQNLKYQINPHFLYNTLQTVEAIGELNGLPELMTISHSLGRMFRYNLESRNLVLLSEEINHLESYFTIEKVRFREMIRFDIDISQELMQLCVLKFILQPMVENAIHHGFQQVEGAFVVRLSARLEDGALCIGISDNGIGIPPNRLAEIRQHIAGISSESTRQPMVESDSIGIINVQRRIVNYFGGGYGLEYESLPGKGTQVIIRLPAIWKKDVGGDGLVPHSGC